MEFLSSLATILAVLCIGIISPGPSFILVARTAAGLSRGDGLATALGMGVGSLIFAMLTVMGLQAILQAVPALYLALKIIGGCYLLFIAIRIWRYSKSPLPIEGLPIDKPADWPSSFKLGLFTQLSNPKTAIYYGSVFAAFLPSQISLWFVLILAPLVFLLEGGWYALVALTLSASGPRRAYIKLKTLIDRIASLLIGALAAKLIWDAP